MQTCSNCGASNREGAKFCTTCGSRLNAVVDTGTSTGWDSASLAEETAVATPSVTTTEAPSTTPTPVYAEEPVATSWSWSQTRTSEELAVPYPEPTTTTTTTEAAESLTSWASQWSTPSSTAEDNEDAAGEAFADPGAEEVAEEAEAAEEEARAAREEIDATIAETDAAEEEEEARVAAEEQVAAATEVQDEPSALFDSPPAEAAATDPRERARTLIAELQGLIDDAVAAPASSTAADAGDTATALATLQAVPDEGSRFDSLRAILEKAREQPRDVDTMLNLLGELDALIGLLDSYEAHATAVRTARQHLGG